MTLERHKAWIGAAGWALAVIGIAAILFLLPDRTAIAPHIQGDYSYTFLAADRLYAGLGPTSTFPRAPFQPWEWFADWTFLTQWPVGYPMLLCAVRLALQTTAVQAGQCIAVMSCAIALVGWFAWARRVLPKGIAATLVAAVAAGSTVSTAALVNPRTDTIVVALLPLVLLMTHRALRSKPSPDRKRAGNAKRRSDEATDRRRELWLAAAGVGAGALFWIRYASVYVPVAIGAVLVVEWIIRRQITFKAVAVFAVAAAVPILSLLAINRTLATSVSAQEQFNLGSSFKPDLDPAILTTAWWNFTDLPFYDYHWYSRWFYAIAVPIGAMGFICLRPTWRKAARRLAADPAYLLSVATVLVLLVMLITATALFRTKYDYVGLDRYYVVSKPFYFLLFVGPLVAVPRRSVRALLCIPLLLCLSWYVQVEWPRPYKRWLAANRPVTDYGRWARCFEPGSSELYRWLHRQNAPHLIVCSNFPDEIALETWVPACPLPDSEGQLLRWVDRIRRARDIDDPRILFVLDPSNHTREYYLPPPQDVIAQFALTPYKPAPEPIRQYVFEYKPDRHRLAASPERD